MAIACRGKFDVAFYPDCLQTLNKQTSAVVPYSSIQHILVRETTLAVATTQCNTIRTVGHASVHVRGSSRSIEELHSKPQATGHLHACVAVLHVSVIPEPAHGCLLQHRSSKPALLVLALTQHNGLLQLCQTKPEQKHSSQFVVFS
jgi:hypothetical protein